MLRLVVSPFPNDNCLNGPARVDCDKTKKDFAPMQLRFVILGLVSVLVLGLAGVVLYTGVSNTEVAAPAAQTRPARPQVDFATAADQFRGFSPLSNAPMVPDVEMLDEAGNKITFEAFRGKVVVFNLWATWCPPCIREMPDLNALQQEFADRDFIVVPVASGKQGREEPAEFLRSRDMMALTTYYDPDSLFLRVFDLETLPTTFVLDRGGVMRGGVIGAADWHSDRAMTLIEALLNEKS